MSTLTQTVNDVVEQAANLLSPPDMSDWTPPAHVALEDQARLEQEEYDRRAQAKIDRYLADRSDRLVCLRAIRQAAQSRADLYGDQAAPWERMAKRQKSIADYCDQLARNVLTAERAATGGNVGEAFKVTLPNGLKVGLRVTSVVIVSDLDMLPGKFVRTKTTREPDKNAIKALLAKGEQVPGARLGTNEHVDWGR